MLPMSFIVLWSPVQSPYKRLYHFTSSAIRFRLLTYARATMLPSGQAKCDCKLLQNRHHQNTKQEKSYLCLPFYNGVQFKGFTKDYITSSFSIQFQHNLLCGYSSPLGDFAIVLSRIRILCPQKSFTSGSIQSIGSTEKHVSDISSYSLKSY